MILLLAAIGAVCSVFALWIAVEQLNEARRLRREQKRKSK